MILQKIDEDINNVFFSDEMNEGQSRTILFKQCRNILKKIAKEKPRVKTDLNCHVIQHSTN